MQVLLEKQARDGRTYTLTDIAESTGLGTTAILGYLHDKAHVNPTLVTLAQLADFFGCAIGDLYEEVEEDLGEASRPPAMMGTLSRATA